MGEILDNKTLTTELLNCMARVEALEARVVDLEEGLENLLVEPPKLSEVNE